MRWSTPVYPAGAAPMRAAPAGPAGRFLASYETITTCGGLVPSRLENSAVLADADVASNE